MKKTPRFWEIDLLRGLAIIGMVGYHLFFDLFFLGANSLDPFSWPLFVLARVTATTFLFLVGFSFSLSSDKYRQTDFSVFFRHVLLRAAKILAAASLVTLVTYLVAPDFTVRFGILHLIAFSLLLLLPFALLKNRLILLPLSLFLILAGVLRYPQPAYSTFDYYPLIPWFGVVLLGFSLAKNYSLFQPRLFLRTSPRFISPLITMGRHSLLLYLIHQPILFGFLFLLKI